MKQYHHPTHRGTKFKYGLPKVVVPKWEYKGVFGVYRYQVDAFIADAFLSLAGNISTDPVCTTSYQSLYSLHMVYLPSNIMETFTNNAPYTDTGI